MLVGPRVSHVSNMSTISTPVSIKTHVCLFMEDGVQLEAETFRRMYITSVKHFCLKPTICSHDAPFGRDRVSARRTNERLADVII